MFYDIQPGNEAYSREAQHIINQVSPSQEIWQLLMGVNQQQQKDM